MADRWWRWRGGLAGFGRDMLFLACAAAVMSALFVAGELALYGHVRW